MTPEELYTLSKESKVLTRDIIDMLMETLEYSSISFLNQAVEILRIFKTRIERGDKITDEISGKIYTMDSFRKFVKTNFSEYIYQHVFTGGRGSEYTYFSLDPCEGGYTLVLAENGKQPTYEWISSLSEKFSLVYMIATKIVYVKNLKTNTYTPFISENGRYCHYDKEKGMLVEISA